MKRNARGRSPRAFAFGARETAEIAISVANVRDGELQVAGATVTKDLADELERALFGAHHGLREIGGSRRRSRPGFGRHFNGRCIVHLNGRCDIVTQKFILRKAN